MNNLSRYGSVQNDDRWKGNKNPKQKYLYISYVLFSEQKTLQIPPEEKGMIHAICNIKYEFCCRVGSFEFLDPSLVFGRLSLTHMTSFPFFSLTFFEPSYRSKNIWQYQAWSVVLPAYRARLIVCLVLSSCFFCSFVPSSSSFSLDGQQFAFFCGSRFFGGRKKNGAKNLCGWKNASSSTTRFVDGKDKKRSWKSHSSHNRWRGDFWAECLFCHKEKEPSTSMDGLGYCLNIVGFTDEAERQKLYDDGLFVVMKRSETWQEDDIDQTATDFPIKDEEKMEKKLIFWNRFRTRKLKGITSLDTELFPIWRATKNHEQFYYPKFEQIIRTCDDKKESYDESIK